MLLNHKLSVKLKVVLDDLKSWGAESSLASLCSTLKLLISFDQVGGPVHHLHHLSAAMQCVNDEGVLHKGDRAAVVPLGCVYSARIKSTDLYLSKCLLLLWTVHKTLHSPASLLHAAVVLQWENSGDHLPHRMRRANEKQHSLITHTVGYFTEITGLVASCGHLDDLRKQFHRQQGALSDGLGTSCIPALPSSVIWGDSKFGRVKSCMKVGCPVIPRCRFLSEPVICCTMFFCVSKVEGGAGRDQWANVWGSEGMTRGEREAKSASSFPLFKVSFIHLQDMGIPTLFQPHIKNRHTLHSLLM